MGLFTWLKKRTESSKHIPCPRCLGKGHVDQNDIIRLNQVGKWGTGSCAYCNGTGKINQDMLSKVPVDATYFTNDLPESERNFIIENNYKRKNCPIVEHNRLWLEEAFHLLLDFFGKENTRSRNVLVPNHSDFPVLYDKTESSAYETMKIVATQMQVPPDSISLDFYEDRVRVISSGGNFGSRIFLEPDKEDPHPAGLYWGKNNQGKFELWINRKSLSEPENLVAALAHEIAHMHWHYLHICVARNLLHGSTI